MSCREKTGGKTSFSIRLVHPCMLHQLTPQPDGMPAEGRSLPMYKVCDTGGYAWAPHHGSHKKPCVLWFEPACIQVAPGYRPDTTLLGALCQEASTLTMEDTWPPLSP
jgi:hypothetical protein